MNPLVATVEVEDRLVKLLVPLDVALEVTKKSKIFVWAFIGLNVLGVLIRIFISGLSYFNGMTDVSFLALYI